VIEQRSNETTSGRGQPVSDCWLRGLVGRSRNPGHERGYIVGVKDNPFPREIPRVRLQVGSLFLMHRSIGFGDRRCVVRSLHEYPAKDDR